MSMVECFGQVISASIESFTIKWDGLDERFKIGLMKMLTSRLKLKTKKSKPNLFLMHRFAILGEP